MCIVSITKKLKIYIFYRTYKQGRSEDLLPIDRVDKEFCPPYGRALFQNI